MITSMPAQAPPVATPSLVLGSSSRYRAELLGRLGLPFVQASPDLDEAVLAGETPGQCAQRLALLKAQAVAAKPAFYDAWVIGSDQTATLDHQTILGKPGSHAKAVEQLTAASGKTQCFYTALALVNHRQNKTFTALVTTEVTFRPLKADTIEAYLRAEQPYDCAGSAKSEGLGIMLIKSMNGPDPSALVGLPLIALVDMLMAAGFTLPVAKP
jgi:septum formation protein